MDYNRIITYLKDDYEKDLFRECIRNLSDKESRIRLSNFAYALRELVREVIADRAPDSRIKECCWYTENINEKGQVVITREQRMKYVIQGGLPDGIVKDEMKMVIEDTTKNVKKHIDDLSKYTHITRDVFYTEANIEDLACGPLNAVESFFRTMDLAKKRFSDLVADRINEELFNVFLYETIDEIDCLSTHHYIKFFLLGEVQVTDITSEDISFNATGRVYVHLQYGSMADIRKDVGFEMDVDYPFEATLSAPIPNDLSLLELSLDDIEIDTNKFYGNDAAIDAETNKIE